jgi:hypothetical protein
MPSKIGLTMKRGGQAERWSIGLEIDEGYRAPVPFASKSLEGLAETRLGERAGVVTRPEIDFLRDGVNGFESLRMENQNVLVTEQSRVVAEQFMKLSVDCRIVGLVFECFQGFLVFEFMRVFHQITVLQILGDIRVGKDGLKLRSRFDVLLKFRKVIVAVVLTKLFFLFGRQLFRSQLFEGRNEGFGGFRRRQPFADGIDVISDRIEVVFDLVRFRTPQRRHALMHALGQSRISAPITQIPCNGGRNEAQKQQADDHLRLDAESHRGRLFHEVDRSVRNE